MGTARDLITGAARLLGIVAQGENLSASEGADGLSALNSMLSSWSLENLMIITQTRETFDLVTGEGVYLIGEVEPVLVTDPLDPTGPMVPAPADPLLFNTVRPTKIERAGIEYESGDTYERPLAVLDRDQFATITNKNLQGEPSRYFCEGTYPLETLHVWPVPNRAMKTVLYSLKPLTKVTTLNQELSLPDGYERTYRFNLAVEWAIEFGKDVPMKVDEIARESKANVKRLNMKTPLLRVDPALLRGRGFNIISGD